MLMLRPKLAVFSNSCYRSLLMRGSNRRCAWLAAIALVFGCVGSCPRPRRPRRL